MFAAIVKPKAGPSSDAYSEEDWNTEVDENAQGADAYQYSKVCIPTFSQSCFTCQSTLFESSQMRAASETGMCCQCMHSICSGGLCCTLSGHTMWLLTENAIDYDMGMKSAKDSCCVTLVSLPQRLCGDARGRSCFAIFAPFCYACTLLGWR